MDQISFLDDEYNQKKTGREIFLESMEQVVLPWKRLEKRIKKHYASVATGRPPYPSPLQATLVQHE